MFLTNNNTFINYSSSSENNEVSIIITTRLIVKNFIITKGYNHSLTLRPQKCWTFRFHMTIPLTPKTFLTCRSIRWLTFFLFRFFSVINFSGSFLLKFSRFSIVLAFCPSVIVPKKVSKVLDKIGNLYSRDLIIKSIHINRLESH